MTKEYIFGTGTFKFIKQTTGKPPVYLDISFKHQAMDMYIVYDGVSNRSGSGILIQKFKYIYYRFECIFNRSLHNPDALKMFNAINYSLESTDDINKKLIMVPRIDDPSYAFHVQFLLPQTPKIS